MDRYNPASPSAQAHLPIPGDPKRGKAAWAEAYPKRPQVGPQGERRGRDGDRGCSLDWGLTVAVNEQIKLLTSTRDYGEAS